MLVELKRRNGSNMHNQTDVDTAQRAIRAIEIETYNLENPTPERQLPPVDSLIVGINIDRDLRREKITRRLKARLDETSYEEMFRQLEIAIHQFAKRQMTWFRGMERRGYTIHWVDAKLPMEEKVEAICKLMQDA